MKVIDHIGHAPVHLYFLMSNQHTLSYVYYVKRLDSRVLNTIVCMHILEFLYIYLFMVICTQMDSMDSMMLKFTRVYSDRFR